MSYLHETSNMDDTAQYGLYELPPWNIFLPQKKKRKRHGTKIEDTRMMDDGRNSANAESATFVI